MDDILDSDNGANAGNTPEYSVSEISGAVKRALEDQFGRVRVRGEIGRVSPARSGHIYFDLKDDRAVLSAVVWKGAAARLETRPQEGDEVVAEGRLTSFPGQSKYQLIVEKLSFAGEGALLARLARLKAALAAEGLFAPERKRALPYLPRVIGVVTSPTGAVIRDILHRLTERFPCHVIVWPVVVQGAACAAQVAAAVRGFNALAPGGPVPRPDVLIVARGGGSVEDLWGFNEEIVVRAVADSAIPVISAVGHETDTTLIDFAADRRAPTPTAAAEIAAPVLRDLVAALRALQARRARAHARAMAERARGLRDLARLLPSADALLASPRQRLDRAAERAPRALEALAARRRLAFARGPAGRFGDGLLRVGLARRRERLDGFAARLRPALTRRLTAAAGEAARLGVRLSPQRLDLARRRERLEGACARVRPALSRRFTAAASEAARLGARLSPRRARRGHAQAAQALAALDARLRRAGAQVATGAAERMRRASRLLDGLSYRATLARGFAVVRATGPGGGALTRAAAVRPGAALEIEFADGRVRVAAKDGRQGSLF